MKHSMVWNRIAMLALVLSAVVPMSARAQSLVEAPVAAQAAVVAPAPTFGPVQTQVGVSRAMSATAPMIAQQQNASRRDVAWMVLGGATLIVGSIVGGDGGTIIMIVGGVIGLTGLWRYLQYS
jgi:hypothetical protein